MSMRAAEPHDVPLAVATLVGAFFDDPLWAWAFPDPDRRRDQHTAVFTCLVASAVERGWVWGNDDFAAVAVWIPPGEPELRPTEEAILEAAVEEVAPERAAALAAMSAAFERAHPDHEPHFYLSLLGTRPDRRGEGLGMRLLAENLRQMDLLGSPAYLESSNQANVARYERVGFEPISTVPVASSGLCFTGMWRTPGSR